MYFDNIVSYKDWQAPHWLLDKDKGDKDKLVSQMESIQLVHNCCQNSEKYIGIYNHSMLQYMCLHCN